MKINAKDYGESISHLVKALTPKNITDKGK